MSTLTLTVILTRDLSKTFTGPPSKASEDYKKMARPRVACNLDLVRCSVVARDVRSLFRLLKALRHAFGSFPKLNNVFGLNVDERAKRNHMVSLNLTVPFDTGMTYGEMSLDTTIQNEWNMYSTNPQEEPRERWERDVAAARELLITKIHSSKPVKILCEVQIHLHMFTTYSKKMHDAYQAARAESQEQMYDDFVMSSGAYKPKPDANMVSSAAYYGQREVCRNLIDAGGDVNDTDRGNGTTALFKAAQNGHIDVVELLLESGANKYKARNNGRAPLFMATENGLIDVVEYLVEKGADKDNARNDGCTPLFIATQKGLLDVVEYLVEKCADKDKATNDSVTPLYIATQKGLIDVVRVLLNGGADANKAYSGWTPLKTVNSQGYTNIIDALIKAGATK